MPASGPAAGVFTALLRGLAPASGGGVLNYLRADATFSPPPAGVADFAQAYATSTQTLTSSVFTKLTGATTFFSSADFDDNGGSAMAIRYIGTADIVAEIHYQARCASIDTSNASMNLQLAKNGALQAPSQVSGQTDKDIQPDTASGKFILALVQNDVIEMQANRNSGAQDIDVLELVLTVIKLS